jgi:predicted metal-dependent hydrolase
VKDEVIEHIASIGEVRFLKSKRAKRINISIKPEQGVRVAVPVRSSLKAAKAFVIEKEQWILKHLERLNHKKSSQTFCEEKEFKTRDHTLKIIREERNNMNARLEKDFIIVRIPEYLEINQDFVQDFFKKVVSETLRSEAKQYIPRKVKELAEQHKFSYNELRLKNIKTRWGSCSTKNNINLSIHLMMLPDHLIDFIILHELCHTIHKNHGPKFKALLDEVSGDQKGLEKEMKDYRIWMKG